MYAPPCPHQWAPNLACCRASAWPDACSWHGFVSLCLCPQEKKVCKKLKDRFLPHYPHSRWPCTGCWLAWWSLCFWGFPFDSYRGEPPGDHLLPLLQGHWKDLEYRRSVNQLWWYPPGERMQSMSHGIFQFHVLKCFKGIIQTMQKRPTSYNRWSLQKHTVLYWVQWHYNDSAEFKNTKLRTVYPEKTPTWKSYKVQIFISLPLFPTCPTALRSGTRKSVGNKLELEILVVWGVLNREDQESINYYLQKLTMQMEKQNSWDCLVSHNQNIDILFIYLFEREQTREKKAARRSDFLAFSSSLSLGYLALPSLFKGG